MNNESNNNRPDDFAGSNEYPVINNHDPYIEHYQGQEIGQTHNNVEEKSIKTNKPRKRGKLFKSFRFIAASMAFGLLAGVVFQGYFYVMDATGHGLNIGSNKIAEVKETTGNKDTIVPSNTSTNGAVVTDVSGVVANVMPSIVAINASSTQTGVDFFGREIAQPVQGSGSGIIIGQNGSKLLIVTNNHVINGATTVQIVFSDGKKASAAIKGADANADLAILSVNTNELTAETLKTIKVAVLGKSDQVKAGDMAIAIGNALGYGQSVTVGYISAVDRKVTIDNNSMTLLQTDAAINPGNSGGALLNTKGEVVGINSVKYASEDVEGMGYAIPISQAVPMMNELINRQAVSADQKGFLGISGKDVQNVSEEDADRFNMPVGVYVNAVIKDTPAAKAGLQQGDIITGVDEIKVKTIDDLANVLGYKKAGQTIDLKIQQKTNGAYKEKVLKITLAKKK